MNACPAPHSFEHSNTYRPGFGGWNVTVAAPLPRLGMTILMSVPRMWNP